MLSADQRAGHVAHRTWELSHVYFACDLISVGSRGRGSENFEFD